jgi:bacteriocin-like protein
LFYESVSKDGTLKQKFVEPSQKYKGEQMDEAKMISLMKQEALPLAAQMGYSFTMDDLKAFGEEMKQAKMNRELSDEEMQAVTGGGTTGTCECAIIGVSSGDFSGFCFLIGEIFRSNAAATRCLGYGYLWTPQ